jgi:hypothetical protein
MFRPETDARSVVEPEPPALTLFAGDLQPLTPPDAFNPLVVDRPARRLQHLGDPAIAEPTELTDQFDDVRDQRGFIIGRRGHLALRGPILTKNPAGSTFRDPQFPDHMIHAGAAACGA